MTNPVRVLVVDDDALQLELLQRSLSLHGFEVQIVAEVAGIAAAVQRFRPDLVLLDVNIPDAPDAAALAIARAAAPPEMRVVLLSASDESTLRALARERRADGWLSKSSTAVDLGAKIKKLLGRDG